MSLIQKTFVFIMPEGITLEILQHVLNKGLDTFKVPVNIPDLRVCTNYSEYRVEIPIAPKGEIQTIIFKEKTK